MLLPSQKCPGGQLSQVSPSAETNCTFWHLMTSTLLHASLVPLPGREMGRVGNVSLHRWHVNFEVAPRTSEKVLAGHFSQSPLFLPPISLKYVPAGHFSGTPAPRPQ